MIVSRFLLQFSNMGLDPVSSCEKYSLAVMVHGDTSSVLWKLVQTVQSKQWGASRKQGCGSTGWLVAVSEVQPKCAFIFRSLRGLFGDRILCLQNDENYHFIGNLFCHIIVFLFIWLYPEQTLFKNISFCRIFLEYQSHMFQSLQNLLSGLLPFDANRLWLISSSAINCVPIDYQLWVNRLLFVAWISYQLLTVC